MKKNVLYAAFLITCVSCNQVAKEDKPVLSDTNNVSVSSTPDTVALTIAAPVAKPANWKGIQKMSDQDFAQKLATANGLTIVDFSAEWCGPCKLLHPIIVSLAKEMEGKVNFGNVDVDESPKAATDVDATSIPLLVFYKDGKIVDKTVGLLSKEELEAKINQHL